MPSPVGKDDFKALVSDANSTLCGNFIATLLRLPVVLYQLVSWMLDDDGELTQEFKDSITLFTTPSGTVIIFAGSATPDGFLVCNGQAVSRVTYEDLFNAIGTTFGVGDGSTTFNVPNLTDMFVRGNGAQAIGVTGGAAEVTLTKEHLPEHRHFFNVENQSSIADQGSETGKVRTGGGEEVCWVASDSVKVGRTRMDIINDSDGSVTQIPVPLPLPPYIVLKYLIKI